MSAAARQDFHFQHVWLPDYVFVEPAANRRTMTGQHASGREFTEHDAALEGARHISHPQQDANDNAERGWRDVPHPLAAHEATMLTAASEAFGLIPISQRHWLRIIAGQAPLPARPPADARRQTSYGAGKAQVLTIAAHDARLTEVEPLQVTTDAAGFVCRFDAALPPLPDTVLDLRPRLQRRFVRRTLRWYPSVAVLRTACRHAGFTLDGERPI